MIVYNNQAPDAVNNVGQFGATEGSIGAYKQAAEYAADSKYWALLAESKFGTIDDLITEVERLYQQGALLQQDIEALKQDFRDQDARLMQLIAQTNAAVSDAQNALALMDQKLIEVQERLDILLGMSVDVTTLSPGNEASGHFDPNTGVISLGIPQGVPGKDGTVTDLDNAPTGVPVLGDVGFYVDKDDNTVHKTTLENIANLIPSVRSVSVNGGPFLDGEVALTINKDTVGLSNVENVASYSRQEINDKFDKTTKTYQSKAEADADAQYRQVGEKVLVWGATKYEFYTVAANKTLTPVKTEGRILTVNSRSPDSSGNIDITIPTGNPSLYLGEMVMFPYDPTKNISYPGVLPADGRLVSKESALDLGPSLISGQLPVVSETEWQAGARQYFSWGKLADEVTDADSTNFISIRLPDWTGGEAIRAPDSDKDAQYKGSVQAQKPYVVTVNNLAPDEITGNVNISRFILGAASSGANSDITSLNGLTTALSVAQGGTGATTAADALSNLGLGSAALKNIGVSGDAVPLLNANNTWSGIQTLDTPLAISSGGTGQTTASAALTALGGLTAADVSSYIAGYDLTVTTNQVSIGPGTAVINNAVRTLTGIINVGTSSLAANQWYHVYIYWNGAASKVNAEVVSDVPVVYIFPSYAKSGDFSRRYIGSVRTDGAGLLIPMITRNGYVSYLVDVASTANRLIAKGTASTPTAFSASTRAYPDTTREVTFACTNTAGVGYVGYVNSVTTAAVGPSIQSGGKMVITVPTENANTFYYQYNSSPQGDAGLYVDLVGYQYVR